MTTTIDSRLPRFRSMTVPERLQHLISAAHLSAEDERQLADSGALGHALADGMIENVIGTFELPLGVAGYFQINGKDILVPMAVEEPSVVAAASFMASEISEEKNRRAEMRFISSNVISSCWTAASPTV